MGLYLAEQKLQLKKAKVQMKESTEHVRNSLTLAQKRSGEPGRREVERERRAASILGNCNMQHLAAVRVGSKAGRHCVGVTSAHSVREPQMVSRQ